MHDIGHILLGLTAAERWAAARRIDTHSGSEQWLILGAIAVLLVLVVLLAAISHRRYARSRGRRRERFAEEALRRGLLTGERQVLLAIAVRSGLRRTHDIFTSPDAFDQGAARLLTEFAQTRTAPDDENLKAGISRLQEKLGFRAGPVAGGPAGRIRSGSREIPVGGSIELSRPREREAGVIHARVVRNDEHEFVVDTRTPTQSGAGESWRARYYCGMSAWEFDTSTVRNDGQRLVLNHNDEIRFINRRRFPRVAVNSPALITRFPFVRKDSAAVEATLTAADFAVATDANLPAGNPLSFVEGLVTELAGPGLRIETSFHAQPDDRVLVVFRLVERTGDNIVAVRRTVAAVGRVKHCQDTDRGSLIAIELIGLNDAEMEELASITDEIFSRAAERAKEQDVVVKPVGAAT